MSEWCSLARTPWRSPRSRSFTPDDAATFLGATLRPAQTEIRSGRGGLKPMKNICHRLRECCANIYNLSTG